MKPTRIRKTRIMTQYEAELLRGLTMERTLKNLLDENHRLRSVLADIRQTGFIRNTAHKLRARIDEALKQNGGSE